MRIAIQEFKLGTQIERVTPNIILTHLPGKLKLSSLDHRQISVPGRFNLIGILLLKPVLNSKSVLLNVGAVCLPKDNPEEVLAELHDLKIHVQETKIILLEKIISVVLKNHRFPIFRELIDEAIEFSEYIAGAN